MVTEAGETTPPADVQDPASPAPAAIEHTFAARTIQRQPTASEAPPMSMTPEYAQELLTVNDAQQFQLLLDVLRFSNPTATGLPGELW